jgi:gamma-glutamyltranspeptidase
VSTGIGGDMFCLFYDAKTGKVSALNGSGRSGGKCTLETIRKDLGLADGEAGGIPMTSVHAATVPGAAAGWVDTVERFGSGKLSMEQILAPAIELGEKGFPVSEDAAFFVCCRPGQFDHVFSVPWLISPVERRGGIPPQGIPQLRRDAQGRPVRP